MRNIREQTEIVGDTEANRCQKSDQDESAHGLGRQSAEVEVRCEGS